MPLLPIFCVGIYLIVAGVENIRDLVLGLIIVLCSFLLLFFNCNLMDFEDIKVAEIKEVQPNETIDEESIVIDRSIPKVLTKDSSELFPKVPVPHPPNSLKSTPHLVSTLST